MRVAIILGSSARCILPSRQVMVLTEIGMGFLILACKSAQFTG